MDVVKINNAREFLSHALMSVSEIGKILTISSEKLMNTKVVYADLSDVNSVIKANDKIKKIISIAKDKLDEVGNQAVKDLNELMLSLGLPVQQESELPNGDLDSSTNNNTIDESVNNNAPEVNGVEAEAEPEVKKEAEPEKKGFIKVVDISKLMEPKKNDSIIVLSDSDISSPEKQKVDTTNKIVEPSCKKTLQSIFKSDSRFEPKCSFVPLENITNNLDKVMKERRLKKVYDDKGKLLCSKLTRKDIAKSKFEDYRKMRTERRKKDVVIESDSESDNKDHPVPEFEGLSKPDIKSSLKDFATPKANKHVSFAKSSDSSSDKQDDDKAKDKSDEENCDASSSNKKDAKSKAKTNRLSVNERNKKSSLRQTKNKDDLNSDSDSSNDDEDKKDDDADAAPVENADTTQNDDVIENADTTENVESDKTKGDEDAKASSSDDDKADADDKSDESNSDESLLNTLLGKDEDDKTKKSKKDKKSTGDDESKDASEEEKEKKSDNSDTEIDRLTNLKSLSKKSKSSPRKSSKRKKSSNEAEDKEKDEDHDHKLSDEDPLHEILEKITTDRQEFSDIEDAAMDDSVIADILNSPEEKSDDDQSEDKKEDDGDDEGKKEGDDEGKKDKSEKKKRAKKETDKGQKRKRINDPLLTEKFSDSDSNDDKKTKKRKSKDKLEDDEDKSDKGSIKSKKKSKTKGSISDSEDSEEKEFFDKDKEAEDKSDEDKEAKDKSDDDDKEAKDKSDDDDVEAKDKSDNEDEETNKSDDDAKKSDDNDEVITEKKTNSDSSDDSDSDVVVQKASKINSDDSSASDDSDGSTKKDNKGSDSDSDIVVSRKKRNVKRKKRSSDESDKSSDSEKKTKKKRLKGFKNSDESSNGSDSDENSPGKGRKNIRKVIKTKNLDEATVQAAKEEKERKQRIEERQRLYNSLYDDKMMQESKVDKLVLDFDPDTKEELITVHKKLIKHLKPHQATGVKFMFDACFESVKQIEKGYGSGCILAHCMGLGKSLQVVTLVHTLLTHYELTKVRCVLVVCPLSTVLNWVNEFKIWLKNINDGEDVNIFELSKFKKNVERVYQLSDWQESGGVMIMGYDMFRNLSNEKGARLRKKAKETVLKCLVDPGPDLVVCDEGHLLKNEKTSLSQAMTKIKTAKRIVLTGTPVQNNLKEYYCMVQFVKPNLLGKYTEYMNRFVNPITNGQYTDSTPRDIEIMKRRSHVLHKMLDGCVQRKDYSVLAPFLPAKHEYVLFINLTELQIKLYQFYLDNLARRATPGGKNSSFLFPDFQNFQRIWTHPRVLKANSERYERDQAKKAEKDTDSEGSLKDFIDDDSDSSASSSEESSLNSDSDDSTKKNAKKNAGATARNTRASRRGQGLPAPQEISDDNEEEKRENPTQWWVPLFPEEELDYVKHSGKLLLLFDILKECEAIGDKILVFSQSLYSLDVIEHFLSQIDECTQNDKKHDSESDDEELDEEQKKKKAEEKKLKDPVMGHRGSWSLGLDYFRLDGSTSCENRALWCKSFNRPDNFRARLFLISTRAGGLGINLVAANRVIIFDVSWNPSHDVQSIFRIYRFGQKKPCYVYRFIARGTMEEKVYERQVTKQAISKRVIDEQQIDRHYNSNDLNELYKFDPIPPEPRPIPKLPKDRLFAELLHGHEKLIYSFHEHDSLLENKEEETLNEDERKAAWEEFENEKKAPPPPAYQQQYGKGNFGTGSQLFGIPMNMVLSLLTVMVKQDNPMLTDEEVKLIIPTMSQKLIAATQAGDYAILERMKKLYSYQQTLYMQSQYNNMPVYGAQYGANSNQMYIQQQQQMLLKQQQQQQQLYQQQQMQNQQQTSRLPNPFSKTPHQPSILKSTGKNRKLPTLQDFVDLDSD